MAGVGNTPNGLVTAYYGTAASCQKFTMDKQDWQFAQTRPDAALWSLSPQSTSVIDRSVPRKTIYQLPPVTNWAPTTAYQVGQAVASPIPPAAGMKIYECTVAGTSASGTGPTDPGEIVADGATLKWRYIGANFGG